jgi:uncharacterized protein (TIGR02172 family)
MKIELNGRIDSNNAAEVEKGILDQLCGADEAVVLDAAALDYISSAGLRVILRLKKTHRDLRIVNVNSEVYEVLDMTGFTALLQVEKAYRVISVEGCEKIGHGANGDVYRIDPETIVKVYKSAEALPEIRRERALARAAFVAGIPTAIPYDVVRIEDGSYGSVFELLNADSFAKLLSSGEKTVDEVARLSADLLKLIHSKTIRTDILPDMKAVALKWADFIRDELPAPLSEKLRALISALPDDPHLLHGDYHLKNLMLQNGEVLLIDMDTLSRGHPIFELAGIYNAYQGFSCADHGENMRFLGIDWETASAFWKKSLSLYLGTEDTDAIRRAEDKIMVVSYTRVLHHYLRRGGYEEARSRASIACA